MTVEQAKQAPMLTSEAKRAVTHERLRILSYAYYVKGTMTVLTVSIFIFHFIFMLAVSFIPERNWDEPATEHVKSTEEAPVEFESTSDHTFNNAPKVIFRVFAAILGVVILIGWTLGGLTIYAGRCIQKRKKRILVYVAAGLNLMMLPYGTAIGIFTFIVLSQSDTQDEYPS